jgi:hypothetical protein
MALLYFTRVSICSSIAEAFAKASHDCLTRMLNGGWSGQTLGERPLRVLFTVVLLVWTEGQIRIPLREFGSE